MAAAALTCIAITGERFLDFRPYVAAIDDAGVVAFWAALPGGRTGVFTGDGGPVATVLEAPGAGIRTLRSHPDVNRGGEVCVYADLVAGGGALVRVRDGEASILASTDFAEIGPLGPTMNERGTVAFRATSRGGAAGVYTADGAAIATIADTTGELRAFDGLPCINAASAVALRADTEDGRQAIYLHDGRALATVAITGDRFRELARFPSLDDAGRVAFCATLAGGGQGVYGADGDQVHTLIDDARFESYRGVLIRDGGPTVFYATPRGGTLGIYRYEADDTDRLVGLGDEVYGTRIAGFALNPVSVNRHGALAIRLELADGRQAIVRAG